MNNTKETIPQHKKLFVAKSPEYKREVQKKLKAYAKEPLDIEIEKDFMMAEAFVRMIEFNSKGTRRSRKQRRHVVDQLRKKHDKPR